MYPGELSGGIRKRAALLRTYLCIQAALRCWMSRSVQLDTITKSQMLNGIFQLWKN